MTTTIFAGGAFTRVGAAAGGDTTPNAFTFFDQFNVPTSVTRTSNPITVTGIDTAASIAISGDASSQYSINGGAFTGSGGSVNNGDTVVVRHTSSGSASTTVDSALTIGGTVSDTFSSTTAAAGGTGNIAPIALAIINRRRRLQ